MDKIQESEKLREKELTEIIILKKEEINECKNSDLLKKYNYKAKGTFFAQEDNILYVGLETNKSHLDKYSVYEDVAISILKSLKSLNITEAILDINNVHFKCDVCKYIFIQALILGCYEFNIFKTKKTEESIEYNLNLNLLSNNLNDRKILEDIKIIAQSVNFVRDIVNTPPNIANSTFFADTVKNEALKLDSNCVEVNVHSNDFLKQEKMGAFLAVNQASNFPAYLVHLKYKPKNKDGDLKRVVIVGKGLVYDTGGLSLKSADYMTTMKADKGGASVAAGIFYAAVNLNLNIELHCILGITDNAIGKNSYRPDDVLISREGKSIEVKNTDAEGRLVLVDCLSFAQDLKPDYLLDFATLTGACVVSLGEYTSGVMGFNDKLKASFVESSLKVNELSHTLPFNVHLQKLLKSSIADISNISSSRYGGAMTAGLFLSEFIRDEYKDKWIHIDIAGPTYVSKEWGINSEGASGFGVRSCIEFLRCLV